MSQDVRRGGLESPLPGLTADGDRGAFGTIEADSRIPGPLGRNKIMLAGALCLTTAQLFAGSAGWQTSSIANTTPTPMG
jgi:hypothetical protein